MFKLNGFTKKKSSGEILILASSGLELFGQLELVEVNEM
jgi:hypothetical protein